MSAISGRGQTSDTSFNLEEALEQIEQIAKGYDDNYKEWVECIGYYTDLKADLNKKRSMVVKETFERYDSVRAETIVKRREFENNDLVEKFDRSLRLRSDATKKLLEEQEMLAEEIAKARFEKKRNRQRLSQLNSKLEDLTCKETQSLPTITYMRKLLAALSQATIHSNKDDHIIEGFIGKKIEKEVIPFRCNLSEHPNAYVHDIWDIINK